MWRLSSPPRHNVPTHSDRMKHVRWQLFDNLNRIYDHKFNVRLLFIAVVSNKVQGARAPHRPNPNKYSTVVMGEHRTIFSKLTFDFSCVKNVERIALNWCEISFRTRQIDLPHSVFGSMKYTDCIRENLAFISLHVVRVQNIKSVFFCYFNWTQAIFRLKIIESCSCDWFGIDRSNIDSKQKSYSWTQFTFDLKLQWESFSLTRQFLAAANLIADTRNAAKIEVHWVREPEHVCECFMSGNFFPFLFQIQFITSDADGRLSSKLQINLQKIIIINYLRT